MQADASLQVLTEHRLEFQIVAHVAYRRNRHADGLLLARFVHSVEQRVGVHGFRCGHLHCPQRVALRDGVQMEIGHFGVCIVGTANAVGHIVQRVYVVHNLLDAFRLGVAAQSGHVGQVESRIEVEHDSLHGIGLTAIGHAGTSCQFLAAHVLEPFAVVERQQQVALLGRRLHHARVGQDDGLVFEAARAAVDHQTVEHARA